MEALESHYFHIPYPGALGLLRECGRPGAGKARARSGNLRPCARLQGEMSSRLHHSVVGMAEGARGGVSRLEAGRGTLLTCLSLYHTSPRARHCGVGVLMARQESYTSARQDRKIISSCRVLKVSRKNKEAEGGKSYLYAIKYGGRRAINQ